MIFAAPIWLLGFLPWAMLAIWLFRGQTNLNPVPFLKLWEKSRTNPNSSRAKMIPPVALVLFLLAMLLGILSAARPVIGTPKVGRLIVIVDRGLQMSSIWDRHPAAQTAGKTGAKPGYILAAEQLAADLPAGWTGTIEVLDVISGKRETCDQTNWLATILAMQRTAIDTHDLLQRTIAWELDSSSKQEPSTIAVLGEEVETGKTGRIRFVHPPEKHRWTGITRFAIAGSTGTRDGLVPSQAMVTIRNESDRKVAVLKLTIGATGKTIEKNIDLPRSGEDRSYFIDLPMLSNLMAVELTSAGDSINEMSKLPIEAMHGAQLVGTNLVPRIEIHAVLNPAVARMIEVFNKSQINPASSEAAAIVFVDQPAELRTSQSGVIVDRNLATVGSEKPIAKPTIVVVDHPVTMVVNWEKLSGQMDRMGKAPDGWQPLVKVDGQVVVAMRDATVRQVWIGFDSPDFSRSVDFVVLWTNVLRWLGGDESPYLATTVDRIADEWVRQNGLADNIQSTKWPGVFKRVDGSLVAVNASISSGKNWVSPVEPAPTSKSIAVETQQDFLNRRVSYDSGWARMLAMMAVVLTLAGIFFLKKSRWSK